MLVSIIIPIYNLELYIEECLESVYQQTYSDIEVVLVNDCSSDHSMDIAYSIIAKYKDRCPTTIIDHEHNKGLSEARNSGMKAAKGEYIYFVDSDDAIMPNAIQLLADVAIRHRGIELVEGKFIKGTYFQPIIVSDNSAKESIFKGHDSIKQCLEVACIWNILLKRKFIIDFQLHFDKDIKFAEDILFRHAISGHLSSMAVLPSITYFYRINRHSMTHNIKQKHFDSLLRVLQIIGKTSSDRNIKIAQINRYCITSLHYWNKTWKRNKNHRKYYRQYQSYIKRFVKENFQEISVCNFLLLVHFYSPYPMAILYSKVMWKVRSIIGL
ncbi:MAG: glycosyltransferase family 2 protein [Mediterranea massiliensis]|nr:glycosyltransferase family 2 protein [Mediterranea massiliensis]